MSDQDSTKDLCVHCGKSTAPGNGRFVNRIGYNDGWACAECSGYDCDRCNKQIYLDYEITPEQCGIDSDQFSDDTRHICHLCLTHKEQMGYDKHTT